MGAYHCWPGTPEYPAVLPAKGVFYTRRHYVSVLGLYVYSLEYVVRFRGNDLSGPRHLCRGWRLHRDDSPQHFWYHTLDWFNRQLHCRVRVGSDYWLPDFQFERRVLYPLNCGNRRMELLSF